MGKPLSKEEIKRCREGVRLFRKYMLKRVLEEHARNGAKNGSIRRDEGLTLAAQEMNITRQAVAGWKDRIPLDQVYEAAKSARIEPHRLHPRIPKPARLPNRDKA